MPIHSDRIWDPLRKKSVRLTPEEEVRQWFISVLHDSRETPGLTKPGLVVILRICALKGGMCALGAAM